MANLLKIKTLMKQQKITYDMLAQMTGLSAQGICQMIRNNKAVSDSLEVVAKALGVPVGYFFDEDVQPTATAKASGDGAVAIAGNNNVTIPCEVLAMLEEKDKQIREKDALIVRLTEKLLDK